MSMWAGVCFLEAIIHQQIKVMLIEIAFKTVCFVAFHVRFPPK